jgi:hypothetical protein
MTPHAPKVFLSYTQSDAAIADRLAAELQQGGSDVFYAKWSIALGDSIVDRIFEDGLTDAKFFLVLLSPRSVDSRWVREEINAAFVRRLERRLTRLIPVIVETCEVPLALRSLKWVDLTTNHSDGVRELVKVLHGVTDKPAVGAPPSYVTELRQSVGGLTTIASTVGSFLATSTEQGSDARRAFTGTQLRTVFPQLSDQEINDAVAELKQYGLVRTVDWFGTLPWRFGQAEPTYALYLHFADAGIGYSPLDDIKRVAAAVASDEQTSAALIAERTGLEPARINRAVDYLDDYGVIQVTKTLGTAPFGFHSVRSTHQTRRFVNENCV